jgi:hypothetical protein
MRQSLASKDVNTEAKKAKSFETIARQLVKTQQAERT